MEIAATLSQVYLMTLPPEAVERICRGHALTATEAQLVREMPAAIDHILGNIPRIEGVRKILADSGKPARPDSPLPTQVVIAAIELENLLAQGVDSEAALKTVRGEGRLNARLLEHLGEALIDEGLADSYHVVHALGLKTGMVVLEDLKLSNGTLLASAGYEVTDCFVLRLQNFGDKAFGEPIRVLTRKAA